MYWLDNDKHKLPHFHAKYGEFKAVFNLNGEVIAGSFGGIGDRLIKNWATLRSEELKKAWSLAIKGKEIPWIPPIR